MQGRAENSTTLFMELLQNTIANQYQQFLYLARHKICTVINSVSLDSKRYISRISVEYIECMYNSID